MAGVLIGAGGMAWQAGKLPMQEQHRAAACWGAFSHKEQTDLMPDLEEDRLWSEEIPARGELTTERSRGECRLGRGEVAHSVTVKLETISNGRPQGDGVHGPLWMRENLTGGMTSFQSGHGRHSSTGMTSPTRAWREIPESCLTGVGYGEDATPFMVVITRANGVRLSQGDVPAQAKMAQAVTDVANAAMRRYGCKDTLPAPGKLPRPPRYEDAKHRVCGVDNLDWPQEVKPRSAYDRISEGSRHGTRTCEASPEYREGGEGLFSTIADSRLAHAYDNDALYGGPEIRAVGSPKVFGTLNATQAVVQMPCKGDDVVAFTARPPVTENDDGAAGRQAVRKMFPRYVTAETKRLGCKEHPQLKMPDYSD